MKQLLTLTLTLLSFSALYAQNNIGLTLFSENGERFILYVNGEQINDEAQANVKVMDISADMIQARVDFEDGSLNDFSSNVMLHPGFMANYMIKVNRKGKYVIRFQSEAPYKSDDVSAEPLIHVPASGSQTEIIEQESQTDGVTLSTSGQVTTTSTTTTTTTKGGNTDTDKVEMKMTVPGMDVEISMAGGVDMEGSSMESTTTVTETIT
ncbi:MAG: hypothetical protein HRT74_02955, partial [Flavobacteriales bacterium]|nr:hypothetical protein [Flavobacteriales bacterium]